MSLTRYAKNAGFVFVILIAIFGLFAIFGVAYMHLTSGDHNKSGSAKPLSNTTVTAPTVTVAHAVSLPGPPFNCSTHVSLVQSSVDYVITGMNCQGSSGSTVLKCNGTVLKGATDVTMTCYKPNYIGIGDMVYCAGSTNALSSPTNLTLKYSCSGPGTENSTLVYNCTGSIGNYSSRAINLPMNTNCS